MMIRLTAGQSIRAGNNENNRGEPENRRDSTFSERRENRFSFHGVPPTDSVCSRLSRKRPSSSTDGDKHDCTPLLCHSCFYNYFCFFAHTSVLNDSGQCLVRVG